MMPWGLEILAVVVDHFARGRYLFTHLGPAASLRIPHDGVRGHIQRPLRTGRLDLVCDPERRRYTGERIIPYRRVLQLPPDIVAVHIAEPADRVPGRAFGPHPQMADRQLLAVRLVGRTQAPQPARPCGQVLCDPLNARLHREGVHDGGYPDPHRLVQPDAGHLAVHIVALGLVGKIALEKPLTQLVQRLVFIVPEADLLPARHVAQPRRVEGVDAAEIIAVGRAPSPPFGVEVPLELGRIGGVDRLDRRRKGLAVGRDRKAGIDQGRPNQITHLTPLVLHPHDELQAHRLIVVMPHALHQLRAGFGHRLRDLLARELRVVAQIRLLDHVENGQIVEVGRGDVCVHRRRLPLVDLPRHKLAVDQTLHRLPHLFDRKRVQPALRRRRRIQYQRDRAGRGLIELDALRIAQLAGRRNLQIEIVEVHLPGFKIQRRAVDVERLEVEPLDGRTRLLVGRRILGQRRKGKTDNDRRAQQQCELHLAQPGLRPICSQEQPAHDPG